MSAQFDPASIIDRANRLMSLRENPGFYDLMRIAQELVQSAADQCADYPGWDAQQIVVLKVRMQCAKEFRELLMAKMNETIREGINAQAASPNLPDKSVREVLETGDLVRQEVLTKFEQMDGQESRLPGSY